MGLNQLVLDTVTVHVDDIIIRYSKYLLPQFTVNSKFQSIHQV